MKLLVVHDGPVEEDVSGLFFGYGYETMEERYSFFSQDISFLVRVKHIEGKSRMSLISKKIKIIEVPNFKSLTRYFHNISKAKKIIKEAVQKADFIILKMHSSNGYLAFKYARKFNKPYMTEYVSCAWDSYWNYSFLGKILAPIMELQTKKVAKFCPYNYYVTKKFLQEHYPSKGLKIGCSDVVCDFNDENVLKNRINKIKELNKSKVKIGTAASLDVKYKGQQYVIKAISLLNKQGYNIEYHLAGGHNPEKDFLFSIAKKYGVEDSIIYEGMYNSVQIKSFYDNLDIYIQPSLQEGLPRSVVEAMSRGCPVLGTHLAGIPELIDEKYMFRKKSVTEIYTKIRMILESDLVEIANENFNKAKEYDEQILNKERLSFYDIIRRAII